MAYCQKCGKKVKDNDEFCPYCGKKTKIVVEKIVVEKVVTKEKIIEKPVKEPIKEKDLSDAVAKGLIKKEQKDNTKKTLSTLVTILSLIFSFIIGLATRSWKIGLIIFIAILVICGILIERWYNK